MSQNKAVQRVLKESEYLNTKDDQLKRIDLVNLQNEGKYQYTVSTMFQHHKYEGDVEAVSIKDARYVVQQMMESKGYEMGEITISIYEWVPETLESEGMWECVEHSMEKAIEHSRDLKQIEGKEIQTAKTMTVDNEMKLRLIFTDGVEFIIGMDDLKNKKKLDWYISPF